MGWGSLAELRSLRGTAPPQTPPLKGRGLRRRRLASPVKAPLANPSRRQSGQPRCEHSTYPLPFRGGVGVGQSSRTPLSARHIPTPNPSPEGEGLKKEKARLTLRSRRWTIQAAGNPSDRDASAARSPCPSGEGLGWGSPAELRSLRGTSPTQTPPLKGRGLRRRRLALPRNAATGYAKPPAIRATATQPQHLAPPLQGRGWGSPAELHSLRGTAPPPTPPLKGRGFRSRKPQRYRQPPLCR